MFFDLFFENVMSADSLLLLKGLRDQKGNLGFSNQWFRYPSLCIATDVLPTEKNFFRLFLLLFYRSQIVSKFLLLT